MIRAIRRWRERRDQQRRQQAVEDLQREGGLRLDRAFDAHAQEAQLPQAPPDLALVHQARFGQYLHALQFLGDMLIATHPDPKWLKRTWELNITHVSDSLFDEPAPFGQEALKPVRLEAWQEMVTHFTQIIDGAVRNQGLRRQDEDE